MGVWFRDRVIAILGRFARGIRLRLFLLIALVLLPLTMLLGWGYYQRLASGRTQVLQGELEVAQG